MRPERYYAAGMAKAKKRKVAPGDVASNRQASFRFDLLERIECGVVLQGTEVKALRNGGAQLKDGYVLARDGELWLHNVHIPPYGPAARANHEPERDRKLLAHARQIEKLIGQTKEKGLTVVPTRIYFSPEGRAKVEIALARGKDRFDKRESIKGREMKRDMERALRDVNR
jgi:SsrA-binding protein